MDEGHNSRRKAGRPKADNIELTVVCLDKVSPDKILKNKSSSWSKLENKNLVKKIKISETDDILEKIRSVFNLNQEWKLYSARKMKLIEFKQEINFESIKSNMSKKNRRLYIGPATYDIISSNDDGASTNDVSNRPSRSHVSGSPVASISTTKNVINRSYTRGLPVDNCDPNSLCSDAELPDIGPSEPTESPDTEPSHNPLNSISGESTNRNINGNYANTSTNGDVNNQSRRGHTNELSDRLVLKGVKYSLVQADLSHVDELPIYVSILAIGDVSYLTLPTNDIENRNINYLILRGVKYILVQLDPSHSNNLPTYISTVMIYGVSYLVLPTNSFNSSISNGTSGGLPVTFTNGGISSNQSIHINTNEGFQSPDTSTSFINNNGTPGGLPVIFTNEGISSNQSIHINTNEGFQSPDTSTSFINNKGTSGGLPVTFTNGGISSNQSIHINTNEGFQSPDTSTSFINNNIGSVNAATCNNGCHLGLFSNNNNNTPSYYTNQFSESASNVQRITDYDDDIIRNFIVYGDRYLFQNNFPD